MKTNSSKGCILLFGVLISVSTIRVVLQENPYIDNIVSVINIISLWFVTYIILEDAENNFLKRLKDNKILGEHTKIKKKTYFKSILKWIKIIIFVLGLVYIFIFANSTVNDIIGLLSLFLSIETDYFSDYIQDMFYKKK